MKPKFKLLKVGIVCYPSIGGSGIVATNLGKELAKRGHEVHFISYEKPFRLNLKSKGIFFHKVNINEYSLFKYPDYTLPLAVTIGSVQEKYKLDILHVHYAVPHATAALLACQMLKQCNIKFPKIITTLHGTDITLLAKDPALFSIIKYSLEKSSGITAVSKSLREDTQKVLNTKKPIEVIYNFFDTAKPKNRRESIRKKLGIKNNELLLIHLSNLRSFKKIPDLLKIVKKIKSPSKLLILAGGDFSQYLPLVKKLGIKNKILVKENVLDIGSYLNAADLGIYTSKKESFGLGILETLAYAKPVLATNIGGIPEVVENNKTGFLFKIGDINGFAKKIDFLYKNPQILNKMGQEARKQAKEKFSVNKIVKKYLDYYYKILNK